MAPLIGFHSVIDRPLSVRRVMPPTTTIANTSAATKNSRFDKARGRDVASACGCGERRESMRRRLFACDGPRGKGSKFGRCNVVTSRRCIYIAARMAQLSIPTSRLDRIAMGLSGLCLVHCVATAVLLGLLASAGGFLGAPIIHEVGLTLAMIIGAFALGRGILEHGFMMPSAIGALGLGVMAGALSLPHDGIEPIYTVVGVLILALGHRLNVMAAE